MCNTTCVTGNALLYILMEAYQHKDGVLLDIANVRVDHLPKEIKEEWVLC